MNNCVSVGVVGGIGNQLFQYYAGVYLAKKLQTSLSLDFSNSGVAGTLHESNLDQLKLPFSFTRHEKSQTFSREYLWRIHQKITRNSNYLSVLSSQIFRLYQSNEIGYDSKLDDLKLPIKVRGYFQTWKYFESVSELGFSEPTLDNPTNWYSAMSKKINQGNYIALHVRRGDYLKLTDTFGILDKNYYLNAIELLKSKETKSKIIVFSDNVSIAKRMFKGYDFIFVNPPKFSNPAESMFLMKECKSIVIANSSFSWWAAKLGNPHKKVVAPATWFKNLENPKDLIPDNWTKLPSSWEYF